MAIPDFQSIMLPFMKEISDGAEHSTTEVLEKLQHHFQLTEKEANQYLPSGTQKTFHNRVFWAKAHLKMASLIDNTGRGIFRLTSSGKELLNRNLQEVNLKLLKTIPGYIENTGRQRENSSSTESEIDITQSTATPEEIIESSYLSIRKNLAQELLSKVRTCSPQFFENLVVDLLVKMGYGGTIKEAGKSIGRSGDEGIDGIIKEDRLGLDVIYIQAKRWENVVGRPELQKFVGALAGQGAKKGVFITTSRFSSEAKDYQPKNETKIVLIDGEQLSQFMIDLNLGVANHHVYEIKKIDNDYFEEE
ncbi:MAG: restriction system protein [Stygiobacter sp.]|nr:MAG: restriction system protein [Stygiobacter sp.]KAF0217479.1 MAG: restriction system [Ignavibacteria bacterium]